MSPAPGRASIPGVIGPSESERAVKRRIGVLLAMAGAVTLVVVLRQGGRESAGGGDLQAVPAPAVPPPESSPADLSAPTAEPVREAISPKKSAKKRPPSKAAEVKTTGMFAIRGRVVDDLGAPVPGFSIDAEFVGSDPPRKRDERRFDRAFDHADGSFALEVVAAGQWRLTGRTKEDRRSAPALVSPGASEEFVLVIPRSGGISGFVVGLDRVSVGDAKVYLHYPGEKDIEFDFGPEPEPRAHTGAAGSFLVEHVAPGLVEIMARHPDYSDGEWMKLTVAPGALVQDVELRLTPGGRIEGYADPSLGDVTDREIGLFSFRGGIGWRDTRTDNAGHFVIEHVMPQDYVIELRPAGYGKPGAQDQPGIRKNITVSEGVTTQVVFGEVRRQIAIHGLVTTGGSPSPGLKVSAYSKDGEDRGESVATRFDGSFDLTVLGAGDYSFQVEASPGSYVFFPQAVPDQSDLDVLFELPSGVLSGRVCDADGHPLSHVGVTLVRDGYTRQNFYRDCYRRLYTSAHGSFEFAFLAPGSYTLRAPDGYQDDSPPPRVPHGRVVLIHLVVDVAELKGVEARLPPEARISGSVVDAVGNPVTDAWVGALDQRLVSLAGDGWETMTDSTGHFEIKSVGPGTFSVRARSGDREAVSPPFEVEAGKTASVSIMIP
jgi:protocatechuate 3,4-dioxygenase beta subunit